MKFDEVNPIYAGKREDFTWVGFGSGSGTNLEECARIIPPDLIFSDKPHAKLKNQEHLTNVDFKAIDSLKHCGSWKKAEGNAKLEHQYNQKLIDYNRFILDEINTYVKHSGKTFDLIVLGGYMRIITNPLLRVFKDKIINVHDADLTILNENKQRKYIGGKASNDVINAGEKYTKSSVIIVDEKPDHGEILIQSRAIPAKQYLISGKKDCDWPALTTALELIADGKLGLGTRIDNYDGSRTVYQKRKNEWLPLLYGGVQVEGTK